MSSNRTIATSAPRGNFRLEPSAARDRVANPVTTSVSRAANRFTNLTRFLWNLSGRLFLMRRACNSSDRLRLAEHVFHHLPQLLTVSHFFHQRLRNSAITYNPDSGSMFHSNTLPKRKICFYQFRELALGILIRGNCKLIFAREFLRPLR